MLKSSDFYWQKSFQTCVATRSSSNFQFSNETINKLNFQNIKRKLCISYSCSISRSFWLIFNDFHRFWTIKFKDLNNHGQKNVDKIEVNLIKYLLILLRMSDIGLFSAVLIVFFSRRSRATICKLCWLWLRQGI